jgi:hypothetical protein
MTPDSMVLIGRAKSLGESDFRNGNYKNPFPSGSKESSAWFIGQCDAFMESDDDEPKWGEFLISEDAP